MLRPLSLFLIDTRLRKTISGSVMMVCRLVGRSSNQPTIQPSNKPVVFQMGGGSLGMKIASQLTQRATTGNAK